MNRRTISREFFSTIAAVLVLGLSVMCAIQTALSAAYFVNERRAALTAILDGAVALTDRFAEAGYIVTRPLGDDRAQSARNGYELFNTSSGAMSVLIERTMSSTSSLSCWASRSWRTQAIFSSRLSLPLRPALYFQWAATPYSAT